MSDVEWCQNCGDVVTDDGCACDAIPKPTGALTPPVSFDEAIKREASALQQLATMTTERDNWETSADEAMNELKETRQQLSASQARCRELEKENASLAAGSCEAPYGDDYGNKRCKTIDQLQATLAAREARIAELVEGLRTIAYADWSPELNKEISAAMERGELKHMTGVEWLAQRLLTQLEAHRKEG